MRSYISYFSIDKGTDISDEVYEYPKLCIIYERTDLTEHAAPDEALVIALDGEGIIGYEGEEYPIKAGGKFKFDKLGKHYVKIVKKFKMALLLVPD